MLVGTFVILLAFLDLIEENRGKWKCRASDYEYYCGAGKHGRQGKGVTARSQPWSGDNFAEERTYIKDQQAPGPFIEVERNYEGGIHQTDIIGERYYNVDGDWTMHNGTMKQTVVYEVFDKTDSKWRETHLWYYVQHSVVEGFLPRVSFKYEKWTGKWTPSTTEEWEKKKKHFADWKLMKVVNA